MNELLQWDQKLALMINQEWRTEILSDAMPVFAGTPTVCIVVLLLFLTFCWIRLKRPFLALFLLFACLGLAVGTADLCAETVKKITKRQRPYKTFPGVYFLDDGEWKQTTPATVPTIGRNFSFYSGHATNSMAFATCAAIVVPPAAPIVYGFALAVGYSRVYVGKHYPIDVVVGWGAGGLIGAMYARLFGRLFRRFFPGRVCQN